MGTTWVIEKGNTLWKIGRFDEGNLVSRLSFEEFTTEAIPPGTPSEIMLTGSGIWTDQEEASLFDLCSGNIIIFKHGDDHPLVTEIENPNSLGTDRIANSFAVQRGIEDYMRINPAWLVVDVGTCITADLIVEGIHLGGMISPGIESRLKSMNEDTHALPKLEYTGNDKITGESKGVNTEDAMMKGAADGIVSEIVGRWATLKQEYPSLGVILTGGGSSNLELGPVTPKFADSNLTLKGYYALLQTIKSV
jgi:type III pantothenate kinase